MLFFFEKARELEADFESIVRYDSEIERLRAEQDKYTALYLLPSQPASACRDADFLLDTLPTSMHSFPYSCPAYQRIFPKRQSCT